MFPKKGTCVINPAEYFYFILFCQKNNFKTLKKTLKMLIEF